MRTVQRTKDGEVHRHVYYQHGIRHEVERYYNKDGELTQLSIIMEQSRLSDAEVPINV